MTVNNPELTAPPIEAEGKTPQSVPETQAALRRELIVFAAAAITLATGYILVTDHVWEDYFITFRHSQNLVEGHGLVYHVGERVHGFTSPLGTLLPALLYWMLGKGSYIPTLWLFRLLSIIAFAAGGLLVVKAFQEEDGARNRWARFFFAVFYLLEIKIIAFSTNGMETGFMLLFLGWGILLAMRGPSAGWLALGTCWAGLMWTRPDGCVYIAALALGTAAFARLSRKQYQGWLLKGAVMCALLYLPWFAWAWWYYGSPIPHTVIGKSNLAQGPWAHFLVVASDLFNRFFTTARLTFLPIYPDSDLFNFHPGLLPAATYMAVFAACYWVFPTGDRLGRFASACFVVLCLYLSYTHIYPWYLGPIAMLGAIALARGPSGLAGAFSGVHARWLGTALALLGIVAVERALLFSQSTTQLRIQQAEIETGTREKIGLWLKAHGRPQDRVFLEPMGYIGYFSGMRMADTSGLVCPEMVELRRKGVLLFGDRILALQPEWAVLRPHEVENYIRPLKAFEDKYELVKTFDASRRLARYQNIPGKACLMFDSVFLVYRRRDLPPLPGDASRIDYGLPVGDK